MSAAAAAAAPQPQTSIYETTIQDADLEQLLDKRAKAKLKASEAAKDARKIDEQVKERIDALDLADAPVRIGGFVVSIRETPGGVVEFERNPGRRILIKPLPQA